MAVWTVVVAILVVVAAWFYSKRRAFVSVIDKIPGPPPTWENTSKISRANRPEAFIEFAKKYGPIFRVWMGPIPTIVLSDPDDIKTVLNSDESKYVILDRNVLKPVLGEGLVISKGEMWARHRKLISPGFSINILKQMVPTMVDVGATLVKRLGEFKPTDSVNMKEMLKNATLDIIGSTAFGTKFDSLSGTENELASALKFKLGNIPKWYMLLVEYFPILNSFPFADNRLLKCNMAVVRKNLNEIVASRKSERFKQSNERDLLGLLLNAREGGVELSEKEIRDEATTFLFAGHDTTAALLMWFFYELALHPEEVKKLQDEADSVLQGGAPTAESLGKMKYLSHAINETFRLHPPVPMVNRRATADDVIRGFKIPKGAIVNVAAYNVHLNENLWRSPREFLPSRWENLNSEESKAFLPFSAGPRSCMGRNFSLLEAKTLASMIIQDYELTLVEDQKIVPIVMVTMTPSSLKMHITKRKK